MRRGARVAAVTGVLLCAFVSLAAVGAAAADDVASASVPSMTVTPSRGLVDLQVVTVSADGLAPNTEYAVRECEAGAASCVGIPPTLVETDAGGSLTAEFTVRRTIHTVSTLGFDCGALPGRCALAVTGQRVPAGVVMEQPISFDPSVPVVLPAVTVDPTSGLIDGQQVQVQAAGFVPDELVFVIQCGIDLDVLSCANSRPVTVDGRGGVSLSFNVRRIVTPNLGVGPAFDCASAPGACAVYVTAPLDAVRTNWVPISFDPSVPLVTDPLLAAPTTGLTDGQVVTITGTIKSNESLAAIQCGSSQAGNEASTCDQSTAKFGGSGATGAVRIDMTVRAVLRTPSGPIDCAVRAGACSIVVGSFASNGELARFPLSFAGAVPARGPAFTG